MAVFKCKMCGGSIEFEKGASVGVCDSCGTKQTLPRLDDDKKANMYDRANHFRRNNDYDKAMNIYEQILNEDNSDAEAYWSLVLCRYGIEYVEDPTSHKRVPTVNRAQFTSIYMDEDYKSALKYADSYQRTIYENEAKAIDDIQKGILEISSKEEPFDVFICYKETDATGRRTQDSVLANDLYHQLTQEGFKVFFSRITLEDKLGVAYEPYIFAALNSAKVMVVIGTKPEYFNAVWVKNEWSRYLALVKNGNGKKMLIPAYKDMDPYDLPEEFSHLQAQDMAKLGFMQDLIRGIKKITAVEAPKTAKKIPVYKDSKEQIDACNSQIEKLKEQEAARRKAEREKQEAAAKKKKKMIKIGSPIAAALIAFIIVLNTVILPASNYKKAMAELDYKDSADQARSCLTQIYGKTFTNAKVGDYITFGSYEQDNDTTNGKENIEWLVLDKQGNKMLIISKYALDTVPYNEDNESVTWETCTLRTWMNNTFYNSAFNEEEKTKIISSKVTADVNPEYSTDPGNDTTDKVFLLSINEVNKYFSSDEARMCVPTEYAIEQGAWTTEIYKVDGKATCCWWLRSPGDSSDHAAGVIIGGGVSYGGSGVGSGDGCVRPALWIEIT